MGSDSDSGVEVSFNHLAKKKTHRSTSLSNSHSTHQRKFTPSHSHSYSSDSDSSSSQNPLFTSKRPKKLPNPKETETIVLSSDSEDDGQPRPAPPPKMIDEDKIEKALEEIKRRVPGIELRRAFVVHKKSGQRLENAVEILRGEMRDINGGKGKVKEKEKEKKGKEKEKVKVKEKKRKEVETQDENEEEEEVDQLESDPEDDGNDEATYWLDVETRTEALDQDDELAKAYKKAAWYQLTMDFNTTNESQIRNTFKLDSCGQLYAPTWLKLHTIKKSEDHIKLTKGERNVDKRRTKDGKWVDRDAPEIPRKLELEMDWLLKYIKGGYGKGKGKAQDKGKGKGKGKATVPRKKDQTVQPKKAAPQAKKSSSKSSPKPKKKKSKQSHDYEDFDCEDEMAWELEQSERRGGGWGGAGWGQEALDRAHKSPKRHQGSPGGSQPAWKGGEQMIGGSGSQRKSGEGTKPFSGKGRSLA